MKRKLKKMVPRTTTEPATPDDNGQPAGNADGVGSNGQPRRRATAEAMAAKQRDISVSEFFAKNRHLLGFDNPRKSLLTTVKEAVDNSLDACEEAGIAPEIWVHLEQIQPDRFRVAVQDNGPGIMKAQIPLIFGKLLYGSKFHRLRMSRGQQGIGISAAGMYGMLTTGKPVKIISRTSLKKPAHYYEIQIDTKKNIPEILNGRGEGVDIPPGQAGQEVMRVHGIQWAAHYDPPADGSPPEEVSSGTRVTIELEGKFQRGRGSVDDYLQQTAIANPHVTLHYVDPEGIQSIYLRSTRVLPAEPKEIMPHPYGVELGRLVTMLKATKATTLSQFLTSSFSRVSSSVARRICETAKVSPRASTRKIGREEADSLFQAIQKTKISAPATDCVVPISEELLLKGLHQVVPGEFYCASTRPPAVYRGNPFQIEVALAYGGATAVQKISLELLHQLLQETDARTLRQFLINTFDGMGPAAADKIIKEAEFGTRKSPGKLSREDVKTLHHTMRNVNISEGQSIQVLRYANRVPLQFKQRDCAITDAVIHTNWRSYGLSQSRGSLPSGPVSVMVHIASVWVPFTSESKEAIAGYPEIEKELRLGLQAVGRKLGMYLRRRQRALQEGERRNIFLRYLGEVASAVSEINGADREGLYASLLEVAKKKTAEADARFNELGRRLEDGEDDYGDNVLIVEQRPEDMVTSNPAPQGPQKKLF
ncbi:MAG: DNA topoisomerase VI subunit B [Pirellulaceae bacterium]